MVSAVFPTRSPSDRVRPTRRCGSSIPSSRRIRPPRRASAGPSCSPCSAASTRPGHSRFRPPSARASSCGAAAEITTWGQIAALAGDHEVAIGYLQRACDLFERQNNRAWLSTLAPELGRSLCALGRYDEAEPLAQLGRELGDEDDFATQMLWRQVQALVHAHRGDHAQAEPLAREAVAISERTDALNWQGDALCDLAEVLAAAGRTDEAAEALEQALDRYERKKNLAMVAQVQPRLKALHRRSSVL
jgi:tetratricopeptide (TPR) repeat protein